MLIHRKQQILDLLKENGVVRVSDLSQIFEVSEGTIRRDLDILHKNGELMRTHGGAVLLQKAAPEAPIVERIQENIIEKRRIGRAAVENIREGEAIFIGSGTTTLELAKCLHGWKNLTVITNALGVMNILAQEEGISIIGIGGLLRNRELSFTGYITEQTLRELRPNKAFLGIRSIHLVYGLTNDFLPEVSTDREIIKSASQVILLADHSKFGRVSTAFIAPITAVHEIITDQQIDQETLEQIRLQGIKVVTV